MDIQDQIDKHLICVKILHGVLIFEKKIRCTSESLDGIGANFEWFRATCSHNIEIYKKCIERLMSRYKKHLSAKESNIEDKGNADLSVGFFYKIGKFQIIIDEDSGELKILANNIRDRLLIKPNTDASCTIVACR